jgi:hypothetical protein
MKTYSSKNTVCVITANGVSQQLTNLAGGDDAYMFKLAEDRAKKNVGIDGLVALSITNDDSGEATIKLMQTSPQNLFLMGLSAIQGNVPTVVPIGLLFQDIQRLDRVVGINGWIETTPDVSRGSGINVHEWKFGFERMTFIFGAV